MPRSIRRVSALSLASLILLLLSTVAKAENPKEIHPTGYVTDLAGVIKPDSKSRLDALCLELQQKTGAQLAIVTVNSLGDESVEQFANDLFKSFGVGQKKQDNGVLLLVAPNDRKYWTEVGYGLEPVINDARAGDAGRAMVPYFRRNDYSTGIEVAARQLANYIAQDKGVTLSAQAPIRPVKQTPKDGDGVPWPVIALFAIGFIVVFISKASSGTSGRGGISHGTWMGGGFGGGNWGGGGWGGSSGGGGGGGFGGFGGGSSGGGGAGGSW